MSAQAIKAFRNLPIPKQASVLRAIAKTKNLDEAAAVLNRELESVGFEAANVAYGNTFSQLKGEVGEWAR